MSNTQKHFHLSPIQMKMRDLTQQHKYFKNLEPWQVDQHKKNVGYAMKQSHYSTLYNTVITNNVQSMYDLDNLSSDDREIILNRTADLDTFNKLIAQCWAIKPELNSYSSSALRTTQFITYNLSRLFK